MTFTEGSYAITNASGSASSLTLANGLVTIDAATGSLSVTSGISVNGGRLVLQNGNFGSQSNTTSVAANSQFVVNGGLLSTSVVVAGSLSGSGVLGNATLSGAGSINPGNSPGILTASATDPSGGLDYNFEFTVANGLPTWNSPTASGNDVLRLTGASPFTASLTSANTITVYLNVGGLALGDTFTGGFFTDSDVPFSELTNNATFAWFLADPSGPVSYMGNNYSAYNGPYEIGISTVPQTADFGTGDVTGQVTRFTVVPEPSSALLAMLGLSSLLVRRRACPE